MASVEVQHYSASSSTGHQDTATATSPVSSAMDEWVKGVQSFPCGDCGAIGSIVRSGRCVTCLECGWSPCLRR